MLAVCYNHFVAVIVTLGLSSCGYSRCRQFEQQNSAHPLFTALLSSPEQFGECFWEKPAGTARLFICSWFLPLMAVRGRELFQMAKLEPFVANPTGLPVSEGCSFQWYFICSNQLINKQCISSFKGVKHSWGSGSRLRQKDHACCPFPGGRGLFCALLKECPQ